MEIPGFTKLKNMKEIETIDQKQGLCQGSW